MSTRPTSDDPGAYDRDGGAARSRLRSNAARWRTMGRRAAGFDQASGGDLLLIFKTAGAAGLAWVVGAWLTGAPSPVLASLAAVLVVQATVYQTMQSGLRRVAGVVLGVLLALVLGRWLGFNAVSLTVVLLLALLVGRASRLAGQSNQVAVSALLVVTVGGTQTGYAWERIYETLLGALVGVLVNVLIVPPVHVRVARDALGDLARRLAELLTDIGQRLGDEDAAFASARTRQLLWTARDFDHEITEIRSQLEHASESLRYSPRHSVFLSPAPRPEPAALLERTRSGVNAVDHIVDQTSAIARALVDVGEGRAGAEWDRSVQGRSGNWWSASAGRSRPGR
ncbi:FUSC family protein [Saccharopolyspora erythraea]|uniref:FUSC family protein n=1 Tax=Saccharopolyspora erythraea TaxID=1836 RepID=UPI001BAAF4F4|nr:aromatic acid exporter family protein [Saccharopolyspora erythraea]QUH03532.1 FUSC family protein [Saccharopolyspora erythraea]